MANRFRDKTMRLSYDVAVFAYETKHRDLFLPNGERRRVGCYGSAVARAFWHGFDGIGANRWDDFSRRTLSYPIWCAGRDMAKRSAAP